MRLLSVLLVAAAAGVALQAPRAAAQQDDDVSAAALSGPWRPAATDNAVAVIDVDSRELPLIPQSFLGLSHEWPYVEEMSTQPKYMDMLNYLTSFGNGPMVVRVGGGSTDHQDFVPSKEVWDSLARLSRGTGTKFILGINLEKGDTALAIKQMQAAQAALPPGSILNFEIGNEPNFYNNRWSKSWQGDWRNVSGEAYIECCFWTDWNNHAKAMACPSPGDCKQAANFAGPAWGHVNVRNTTINWFLNVNKDYVGLTTLHWYKATKETGNTLVTLLHDAPIRKEATKETDNTPVTLLDDAPIRKEMTNLKELVRVSKTYGKPLRVAEMNSISNSGRDGISNVFASALWTLDAAFEVAATGAVGINLHQGAGQNLYSALIRWYDENDNIRPVGVRPVFYGMLMFNKAVGSSAQMLKSTLSGSIDGIKVWPLWNEKEKALRIVVINKRPSTAVNVTLAVNKPSGFGFATITRMVAPGRNPLEARTGVTVGGQNFNDAAELTGSATAERILRSGYEGKLAWRVYMPPASAALVVIPKANY